VAILVGRSPEHRYSVHRGYVDAVSAAGGLPLVVPAGDGIAVEAAVDLVDRVGAILLSGGGDVSPALYGGGAIPELMEVDPARDDVEAAVLRAALARGKPVLGICRGIQLLVAALGGSLVQDLPTAGHDGHWNEDRQYEPVHGIEADTGTLAAAALSGSAKVNSIHHQAVAEVGPHLVATAWSDDGVIEAVEADGVLGVQWHPERLFASDARHLKPFEWLCCA
jgi:putative glutamine amidotransferase